MDDAVLRGLWGAEGGAMRAARLERPGSSTRLELFHWEGCTGRPIRDPRRPWDPGVLELRFAARPAGLERHCEMLADDVFLTPFGERCRIAADEAPVGLSVESAARCDEFFGDFLGWDLREWRSRLGGAAGAASVSSCESALYAGGVEASCFQRVADPRAAVSTAERMSPAFTGVWMLTACADRLDGDGVVVEVPFVGRRRAVVTRAPGGVRFGIFEREPA